MFTPCPWSSSWQIWEVGFDVRSDSYALSSQLVTYRAVYRDETGWVTLYTRSSHWFLFNLLKPSFLCEVQVQCIFPILHLKKLRFRMVQ